MEYLVLANKFLYLALAGLGISSIATVIQKNSLKPEKLANNDIKGYKELRKILGTDGLKISKNVKLKLENDFEGICLLGPTGEGKTTSLFLNNLLDNSIPGSLIVTDPKGELFELTSNYQKNVCGRKVYKIDFSNVDYSERYNLLENCKTTEEVLQLANMLLMNGSLSVELASGKKAGGVEWIQMSEPLLSAALLYVKELKKPYNTIEFALQLLLSLNNKQLKCVFEASKNLDVITQFNIFQQVGGADRTEGSIKITLASNMKLFTDRTINKLSSETTFDINRFRKEPSILYIIYPERKSSYLAPFIAPLFSQIIDKLLDNYSKESLPVHLMFDEFGNIGMLNNMSINAATVRSRKISLVVCLQSITQLYQIYGRDNAKSILNNLKAKILLPSMSDIETINYISNLCGNIEINTKTMSESKGTQSYSYSKAKRKMFEEGELRTLEDRTALIINSNKMPVKDELELYFETKLINNVREPIEYPKFAPLNFDIRGELKKIKSITNQKEEEINDNRAYAITRRIFEK